jgi:hypothetical protein
VAWRSLNSETLCPSALDASAQLLFPIVLDEEREKLKALALVLSDSSIALSASSVAPSALFWSAVTWHRFGLRRLDAVKIQPNTTSP